MNGERDGWACVPAGQQACRHKVYVRLGIDKETEIQRDRKT
jgi:hypothetical protein